MPFGVVAVIAPWNFPLVLDMRWVAPALATGKAVLLKPASETATCCRVVIAELFQEAGLPEGVLHMLSGKGSELGNAVAEDPNVGKVFSTGRQSSSGRCRSLAGKLQKVRLRTGRQQRLPRARRCRRRRRTRVRSAASSTRSGCMAVGRHLAAESWPKTTSPNSPASRIC
ncbi:aldehyde dehydrogenase family protein [Amycolatopsis sp. CA-128772]|uniref:aldehyde dehydrogenase family protein n=1 Tax=Amycolatopsis sp. CA-128772 TaxID=2073159 RepID=UPI001E57E2B4|nr:aldehyde dehydrogenase family protein [Amycolatopsis sp. CA-128772]